MSTGHLRLIAAVAVIAAAALTGAVTGLLATTGDDMFAIPAGATGFAGAGVTGLTVLALLGARLQPPTGQSPVSPASSGPDPQSIAAIEQLTKERRSLIDTCIYVRDRATSQAISDRIGAGLSEAGITTVAPVNERFDPTRHEAGGTTPAPDPSHDGVIAVVETAGYADRTAILRNPIVTVYRQGGS